MFLDGITWRAWSEAVRAVATALVGVGVSCGFGWLTWRNFIRERRISLKSVKEVGRKLVRALGAEIWRRRTFARSVHMWA
jgi:hypothetical protein